MRFKNLGAELYIPDGLEVKAALARTTHLGIAAHADDLEIFAYDGILQCFQKSEVWFTGVVLTDGRGSTRDGDYQNYTNDKFCELRKLEQKKAAVIGEYAAQFLLNYRSETIKDVMEDDFVDELQQILSLTQPRVVYTHSLTDQHETHVAVALNVIRALRELPTQLQPEVCYGGEVWGGLDWLPKQYQVVFDLSAHENLAHSLLGIFDSQLAGKRYDLAVAGRRRAHATFMKSDQSDQASSIGYALDLTPLIKQPQIEIADYIGQLIRDFESEIMTKIKKFS